MLGEEDDLADVLAVVRELAVDRLDDRVRLAADRHGAQEVCGRQGFERGEEAMPAVFPSFEHRGAVFLAVDELASRGRGRASRRRS